MSADGVAAMWGLGDYEGLAARLEPAAELLVAQVPDGVGRVLDLAAGTGNVARRLAVGGRSVLAADLSPRMVELGRQRTSGLDVTWAEADAEDLPFTDGSVDAVLSSFGVMFAPHPSHALAQARRVLAPGGLLALTAWTPDGFMGRMTETMRGFLPPAPEMADALDWGREAVVRGWLADAGFDRIEIRTASLPWHFDSPAAMTAFLLAHSPVHVASAGGLGERAAEMFAAVEELAGAGDRPVRLDAEYVLITALRT